MKKFWFQVVSLALLFVVALALSKNEGFLRLFSPQDVSQPHRLEQALTISDSQTGAIKASLNIEVADTREEKSKGLGGRQSLATDSGMLFVYDQKEKYKFWMKNVKFALDIIWIDGDMVVDIIKNVPPPESKQKDETLPIYEPIQPVDSILEVNAGFTGSNNITVGDKIEIGI